MFFPADRHCHTIRPSRTPRAADRSAWDPTGHENDGDRETRNTDPGEWREGVQTPTNGPRPRRPRPAYKGLTEGASCRTGCYKHTEIIRMRAFSPRSLLAVTAGERGGKAGKDAETLV